MEVATEDDEDGPGATGGDDETVVSAAHAGVARAMP